MLPTALIKCTHEQAISDLYIDAEQGGGCDHWTFSRFYHCGLDYGGLGAENTCCLRRCTTLQECKNTLDTCLSYMYNEGLNNHIYESYGGTANREVAKAPLATHPDRYPRNTNRKAQIGHYRV